MHYKRYQAQHLMKLSVFLSGVYGNSTPVLKYFKLSSVLPWQPFFHCSVMELQCHSTVAKQPTIIRVI